VLVTPEMSTMMSPPRENGAAVAQKVQTLFVDDIDGSDADGTIGFGLDGTDYEIDLNAKRPGIAGRTSTLYRCCPPGRRRYPAASPQRAQGASERSEHDGGPRVGQGAGP
jgi:Lsr2